MTDPVDLLAVARTLLFVPGNHPERSPRRQVGVVTNARRPTKDEVTCARFVVEVATEGGAR